jgi:hypothetical protein
LVDIHQSVFENSLFAQRLRQAHIFVGFGKTLFSRFFVPTVDTLAGQDDKTGGWQMKKMSFLRWIQNQ